MMGTFKAASVIARRDFDATVRSRTFAIFLLFPVIMIAITFGFGTMSAKMERQENRPRIAVIASDADFAPIAAARERLRPAFREYDLPELVRETPDYDVDDQAKTLLAAADKRLVGVLSGGIAHPRLTGAFDRDDRLVHQVEAMVVRARQESALVAAHVTLPPVAVDLVKTEQSAGALAANRSTTARVGQWLLFMVTVLLASMLLSNLVEEKSNKIIEVLAAAIPVDAIFFGKLGAMLAVSLTGLAVWVGSAIIAVHFLPGGGAGLPEPAVGWPVFIALGFLYFAMNYLLLGALFLGIGSQASSAREVQSISMPVTIGQVIIFLFASAAAGAFNSLMGISAAIFPFSSPMMMIARAAETPELWTHALALLWQAAWVWIIVQFASAFFRRHVLKSGGTAAAAFGRG